MGKKCKVCTLPGDEKKEVEKAIISGGSLRGLSKRFAISPAALSRHRDNHMSQKLIKAERELQDTREGLNLITELDELIKTTKSILEGAEGSEHRSLALNAVKELRGLYETVLKLQTTLYNAQKFEKENSRESIIEEYNEEKITEFMLKIKCLTPKEQAALKMLLLKVEAGVKSSELFEVNDIEVAPEDESE
ncbi:MAG: hypothetical protein ACOCUL_02970 [Bacteroidota bacterium]